MAYEIRVSPTEPRPTHHIKLTDGVDTVGLILCDPRGNVSEIIDHDPLPREAIKMYQGEQKHSDLAGPYRTLSQEIFSGGRGKKWFEDDQTRYYDGIMNTTIEGRVLMPPMVHYAERVRYADNYMPDQDTDGYVWVPLYGTSKYITRKFTGVANYTCYYAEMYLRKVGSPSDPGFRLKNDNAGEPGTVKATFSISIQETGVGECMHLFVYSAGTDLYLGTPYWFEVYGGATADADNYWEVLANPQTSNSSHKISSDGSSYSNTANRVYGRVMDNNSYKEWKFFEYRGALYAASKPDSGTTGYIYMQGDRGMADDNSANKDRLIDATKSWEADLYNNAIVEIVDGDGYEEALNWREILDTLSTYLVCNSPLWNITHNPGGSDVLYVTEYVIKGTKYWKIVDNFGTAPILDVKVAGNKFYGSHGKAANMYHRIEIVDTHDGTWEATNTQEKSKGELLEVLNDPEKGAMLYWSRNDDPYYGAILEFTDVPSRDIYLTFEYKLVSNGFVQQDYCAANVSPYKTNYGDFGFTISADFTTGLAYSLERANTRDIRHSEYIWAAIYVSKDLADGVLQILLDDDSGCGSPVWTINCPALRGGIYNEFMVPLDVLQSDDAEVIKYIGFNITTDQDKEITIVPLGVSATDEVHRVLISDGCANKITGLTTYGEPEAVWCFTEGGFGEVRNNVYQPSPLSKQIAAVKNRHNGRNPLPHDVYLFFPLGESGGFQRYYQNVLDSIGLDRDEGLPPARRGPIYDAVSYQSMIFVCVNGLYWNGTSAIFCYANNHWHEFYRAPHKNLPIRNLYIQSMPDPYPSRLWFSMGADICWLDLDLQPDRSDEYLFSHVGYLETGYIYSGMMDVDKLFLNLRLMTENLSTSPRRAIKLYYRVNTTTSWTKVTGEFDTSPSEELQLSSSNNLSGKWIQFRLVFDNSDADKTIVLYSWALELFQMAEIKDTYKFTFRLADNDQNLCDMYEGKPADGAGADEKAAILKSWIDGRTALTMSSISSLEDNKTVIPTGTPMRRIAKIYDQQTSKDVYIAQISVMEI